MYTVFLVIPWSYFIFINQTSFIHTYTHILSTPLFFYPIHLHTIDIDETNKKEA